MLSWGFCSIRPADGPRRPGRLDFEVSARAQSMADVADFRERALVAAPAKRRDLAPVVASGRTLGTSSRLLYDLLAHVYDWLGFGEVGDEVFRTW